MSAYANSSITVPEAIARAISTWKEESFEATMGDVRKNLTGGMIRRVTGQTLSEVESSSGLEPFGFRLKTTTPHLIARQKGSPRKAFFVKPVHAQALSWVKGGTRYFSKGHMIPAWRFPVQPVFEDAVKKNLGQMSRLLEQEMQKAFANLFPDVTVKVE